MAWKSIQIICRECKGTGKISYPAANQPDDTCVTCGGTGYVNWGRVNTVNMAAVVEAEPVVEE